MDDQKDTPETEQLQVMSPQMLNMAMIFQTTEPGKLSGEAPYKYPAKSWEIIKLRARYGRDAKTSHTPGKVFTVGNQKYRVGDDGAWRKIKED